jgi:hypothetical protein
MMRSPSEYIAPFDEDRQTGLVQTVPAGGVVAVGVGVAVVAVGDAVALEDAVADWDAEAVAEWLAVLDSEAVAEWLAELDDEADADVEAVPEADAVGGFVAEADALMVLTGGVVAPSLSTVKAARRMELAPYDHLRTAVIVCRPSTSFAVSKGRAEPSFAVPPKSKGGTTSVRTGALDRHESSR